MFRALILLSFWGAHDCLFPVGKRALLTLYLERGRSETRVEAVGLEPSHSHSEHKVTSVCQTFLYVLNLQKNKMTHLFLKSPN